MWDMRTLPEGNAVKTVGNVRHVEGTKHCTGGKHGKHDTGGGCWDMRTLPEGNAVKTVGHEKRSRHIEAMKSLKRNGGPRPVGYIGRKTEGNRRRLLGHVERTMTHAVEGQPGLKRSSTGDNVR